MIPCPGASIDVAAQLIGKLPADFAAPIAVAPGVPSAPEPLADLIRARSRLPVRTVRDRAVLRPGTVFVVASEQTAEVDGAEIRSTARRSQRFPSLDHLIVTAARSYGERLIVVILPETDAPTAALMRHVKNAGGTVMLVTDTQGPTWAPLPLVPMAVDVTGDLDHLATVLQLLTAEPKSGDADARDGATAPEARLVTTLIDSNVTALFRDPELFAHLQQAVLPELIARAQARGPEPELRFWSAGCATGEEAYSLAILLAEHLGDELKRWNVRIFATDLDEDAVQFARRGIYPATALTGVSPERLARFFMPADGAYEVRKAIRSLIIFGQHDLAQRAPFPRLDLVLCRNVLIHFTPELQRRALQLFAFSLRDGGILTLGKAESADTVEIPPNLFSLESLQHGEYRRHGERIIVLPLPNMSVQSLARTRPAARNGALIHPMQRRPGDDAWTPSAQPDFVLEHLPVGVIVVDRRYHIRAINLAARRMLAIHGAAIDDDLLHITERIDAAELREVIDSALQGIPAIRTQETRDYDLDASGGRDLQVTGTPGSSEDGRPLTVTVLIEDVTELVRQRDESRSALERETASATGLAALQRSAAEANANLSDANEKLSLMNVELMSSNEEMAVERQEALTAMEEIQTLNEELLATNEELGALNEEQKVTLSDLQYANADLDARQSQLQHMTESLERQRRASESERARLSAVLLSVGDPIVVVDPRGTPVMANPAYEQLFGRGTNTFLALDAAGRLLAAEEHPLQRAGRGESFTVEFTTNGPDGSRRRWEATGEPVPDSSNERGVLVIRDVTERSIYRIQDEFLALASHELRTPLSATMIYLELLDQKTNNNENLAELHQFATRALHQAQRLKDLITDLMDMSRLKHGKLALRMRTLDLSKPAKRAIEAAQALPRAPAIQLIAPEESINIQGDPSRIEQVILNLLINAIAHSQTTEEIQVRVEHMDPWGQITVQDAGSGIPQHELATLFDRFRQVTRARESTGEGLGLGLYIAKEIVTAHGGTIGVDSEPGKGSTFTVRFPITSNAEISSAEISSEISSR